MHDVNLVRALYGPPEDVILRRYKVPLLHLMKEEGKHPASPDINRLGVKLLEAVEKGIEETYGLDIAFGIGMLKSHIFAHRAMKRIAPREPNVPFYELDTQYEVIEWLRKEYVRKLAPRGSFRSHTEYDDILTTLRDDWEIMPKIISLNVAALSGNPDEQE